MIRRLTVTLLAIGCAGALATGQAAAQPRVSLHDGTQVVGEDVQPDLYFTEGPDPDDYGYCFIEWLPYKGARSSELLDIQSYEGPSYVQLNAGDVVTVDGCDWTLRN